MDVPCAILQCSDARLSLLGVAGDPSSPLQTDTPSAEFNLDDYQIALLDANVPANLTILGSSSSSSNNSSSSRVSINSSSVIDFHTEHPTGSSSRESKAFQSSSQQLDDQNIGRIRPADHHHAGAGTNPSSSPKVPMKTIKILPKSHLRRSHNGEYSVSAAADATIRLYSSLYRHRPRRVVPIPTWGSYIDPSASLLGSRPHKGGTPPSSSSSGSAWSVKNSGSNFSNFPNNNNNNNYNNNNRSPNNNYPDTTLLSRGGGGGSPRRQSITGWTYSGGGRHSPLANDGKSRYDLGRSASSQQPGGLGYRSSPPATNQSTSVHSLGNGRLQSPGAGHSSTPFYCIPVIANDKVEQDGSKLKLYPLARVLSMCRNGSPLIDPESRHLLLRLEQWLSVRVKTQPGFQERLFIRPPATSRLLSCVHNPAHVDETNFCCRRTTQPSTSSLVSPSPSTSGSKRPSSGASSSGSADHPEPSELRIEDRRANNMLVAMMKREKCNRFIMNPLFNSSLPYKVSHGQAVVQYFARNRPEPPPFRMTHSVCPSDSSDSGSWMDDFPLHKYSYLGHSEAIQIHLHQGCDPDQLDRDAWAPIHYAAWYGQLAAVRALLNYGNCDVNVHNHNSSTPLHFAAWRGHHYVVELLLSHPGLRVDARDKDGKTALDLCDKVPKTEWQACAKLLHAAQIDKLPKIQVDLMDGSNVMVPLLRGAETTTADIHAQICEELKLPETCGKMFALWICSESLQIQLKADQMPMRPMRTWREKLLIRLTDCQDPSQEEPRLVFRRDAKLSILVEKKTQLTDTTLGLLFHEARQNYERGLYPCADHDSVLLAAILLQIIHGNYDPKKTKHFLANDRSLVKLLPQHKVRQKSTNWAQRILSEHKHVTAQGPKSITVLQYQFLSFCWNLRVYGSAFFNGIVYMTKPKKGALHIHVGVNDFGLHLIHSENKGMFQSYPHERLQWSFAGNDRPYIEVKADQNSQHHAFTLQTRQAPLINTLLGKLHPDSNSSTQSSPALAR